MTDSEPNNKCYEFMRPVQISDELAIFLNKPIGTFMRRTDVTNEIKTYICQNNINTVGKKINSDAKLFTLLKIKPDDELTYFNLQKYLSCHYIISEEEIRYFQERDIEEQLSGELEKESEIIRERRERDEKLNNEFGIRTMLSREQKQKEAVTKRRIEREKLEKQMEENEFKIRLQKEEAMQQKEARYLEYKKLHQSKKSNKREPQVEEDLVTLIYNLFK